MFQTKENFCYLDKMFEFGGKKRIWHVDTKRIHQVVEPRFEEFVNNPVFVMQDHDGAGRIWDWAYFYGVIPSNSTLVHVDADDDLVLPGILPEALDALLIENYEVGSFILPRVNIGMIRDIVWIQPKSATRYSTCSLASIESPRLLSKPSVRVTKDIPLIEADLLDIDLDFFTAGLSEFYPDFLLKNKAASFISSVVQKIRGVKVITIATSPGYIQSGRERLLLQSTLEALLKN